MSDRGNKIVIGTIAIIKQVGWPAKSRLAFEFKTQNCKYAIIAFRCDNSLYTMLPDPFSHAFRGLGHETNLFLGHQHPYTVTPYTHQRLISTLVQSHCPGLTSLPMSAIVGRGMEVWIKCRYGSLIGTSSDSVMDRE